MPHKDPDAARAYAKRRRATPEGRAAAIRNNKRYRASPRGRVTRKCWDTSLAGRRSQRATNLKQKFEGLTLDQWGAMFAAQGCACLVCGALEPGSKIGWHTHH